LFHAISCLIHVIHQSLIGVNFARADLRSGQLGAEHVDPFDRWRLRQQFGVFARRASNTRMKGLRNFGGRCPQVLAVSLYYTVLELEERSFFPPTRRTPVGYKGVYFICRA
jgi:hypothetical protein